ncbi:MAG: ABC transporter permease [Actinobacteria bacterium]|uniref:ABC transporter permease n=1 Tax=Propionicimonas sp. T2.31MG-18 TaxID=3157620 RepID=UPI0035EC6D21|nr:ABC transporter permease [Actinomycetota bacterium]
MAWLRRNLVVIAGLLVLAYILLPNLVVTIFSFNKPNGRFNYEWNQFSLDAWLNPCASAGMCEALGLSLWVAVASALAATLIGTMAAFALARYRFRGRAATNLLVFFPMATPEVVMGSSLLTLFVAMGVPTGQMTILIAHILFTLSFVVTTVKARVSSLDPALEQAAADLYARPSQAFWKVTFPLVAPGIAAGALLAFALSFDDYIVTNFNAGASTVTFPMYVWGAAQRGTPVQINVVGTVMFFGALAIVGIGQAIGARRRKEAH